MDWKTKIVVLVILVFFIWGACFIVKIWRNTREIEKYLKQKGDVKEILSQSKLKPLWDLYEKTFIDGKTTIPAEEFFNEEAILNICGVNTKMMRAMAGTLVGIGVLGTFLGLTFGLRESNFKGHDVEKMLENINVLLGGMKTAFITSLVGMGASILYTSFEKWYLNRLYSAIINVCDKLNFYYYISPEQMINAKIEEGTKKLFGLLTSHDEQGNRLTLGNTLRVIREKIEKISNVAQNIDEEFMINITNKAVSESLKPVLEKLDNVANSVVKPGENIVEVITNRLETVINKFSENMVAATDKKIVELREQIVETSSLLNKIPENVQKATETLQAFSDSSQAIMGKAEEIINACSENLRSFDSFTEKTKEMLEKVNSLKEDFTTISEDLTTASKTQNYFLSQYKTNIESQNERVKEILSTIESSADKLERVESSLQSVFSMIEQSINDYRDSIGENISSLLKGYAEHTKGTIEGLKNAADALGEVVQDLSDINQNSKKP